MPRSACSGTWIGHHRDGDDRLAADATEGCLPVGDIQPLIDYRQAFEPCQFDFECCTGRCKEDVLGFKVCGPIGGCKTSGPVLASPGGLNVWGMLCGEDCDCCSALCTQSPDGLDRCEKPGPDPDYWYCGELPPPEG